MTATDVLAPRDLLRTRLVEVAADLLATKGPEGVTTRSVAHAAGVQAPMIYRIFGDKERLLAAVAEHGFAHYMAEKRPLDADDDPVENLRSGWYLHIGFGLANPALFRLMNTALLTPDGQRIADAGGDVLRERVRRVARAGRLRVADQRAVDLIRAAGTGVVFTLIDQPEAARDESLADLAWESVCSSILTPASDSGDAITPAPAAAAGVAALTLRAALPDLTAFTDAERALLGDWLDRLA
ncbi:TetR/AcrR family transcriptional regulator [Subtercola boreus]|nr:TetR/AcrR family transcriptional regulator [Subtercola boreus]TQL55232.1 TetR family transcriptional regulator [Subtercola boreus]